MHPPHIHPNLTTSLHVQEREADLRLFVEVTTQACLPPAPAARELAEARAAEAKAREQVQCGGVAGWRRKLRGTVASLFVEPHPACDAAFTTFGLLLPLLLFLRRSRSCSSVCRAASSRWRQTLRRRALPRRSSGWRQRWRRRRACGRKLPASSAR